MIAQLSENRQEGDDTPTDDREALVAIRSSDGDWIEYRSDEIAEVITLPGGMVQAIDMTGDRYDPIPGDITMVNGESWSAWTKRGDETTRHDDVTHVQQNPNGEVVLVDGASRFVGTSIRRAKKTKILES
jgi:hypothetical protein